ncbi:MAG: TylF/MycF/NovP-related O-methyltransferase [Actinomycetota bacterium]
MLKAALDATRDRSKRAADRVIRMLTNRVMRAWAEDYHYSPKWHVHVELLRRAQRSSADYVQEHMTAAVIEPGWRGVIRRGSDAVDVDGMFLEFGVRTGETITEIARLNPRRQIHGFDSFQGLPEPWTGWFAGAGTFKRTGLPDVPDTVELVVGWFDDTLPGFMAEHDGPVAFVHADADLYSSTTTILDHVGSRLRPGSVIVFNEYFNYPNWQAHEFRAWQEFVEAHGVTYDYLAWGHLEVAVRVTAIDGESF